MAQSEKILVIVRRILFVCLINHLDVVASFRNDSIERIIGGEPAAPGEFPYFVSVRLRLGPKSYHCGGSIIDENTILTAAHCFHDKLHQPSLVTWIHPNYDNKSNKKGQKIQGMPILHEKFNEQEGKHDIAVVKLSSPLNFDGPLKAVRLASRSYGPGTEVTVAGFGTRNSSHKVEAPELRKHSMKLVDDLYCQPTYKCSKPKEGFTCFGDSGGPMVYRPKEGRVDRDELVALVSYGEHRCRSLVEFHTDVYYFRDWIADKMRLQV